VKRLQRPDRPFQTCCRGAIRARNALAGWCKRAVRGSLVWPLGHFYGYESAAIQGISAANAAISRASVRWPTKFVGLLTIAHASHALYIAVI
jgi:hypothetical protein